MTGHGQARREHDRIEILVEVRTVNNRFLKLNIYSDLDATHQSRLEVLARKHVQRGTVTMRVSIRGENQQAYELNEPLIRQYWLKLTEIAGGEQSVNLESVLTLPGIVNEATPIDTKTVWPQVESAATEALENLTAMRTREGETMQQDLLDNCDLIREHLAAVETRAPAINEQYATRLTERLNQALQNHDVEIRPADVIREVGVFAERSDFSEETVRLGTHIDHFREIIDAPGSNGRKLDFLVQELLRETNTIGSKANDSAVSNSVVEMKTVVERLREMVQNIE